MLRHGQRKTSGVRSRFGRDGTGPYPDRLKQTAIDNRVYRYWDLRKLA